MSKNKKHESEEMIEFATCSECGMPLKNVGSKNVKCGMCVQIGLIKLFPEDTGFVYDNESGLYIEKITVKVESTKPKGWHLQKEFVDKDGSIYHKGKLYLKAKKKIKTEKKDNNLSVDELLIQKENVRIELTAAYQKKESRKINSLKNKKKIIEKKLKKAFKKEVENV